jgi:hypothetical protein
MRPPVSLLPIPSRKRLSGAGMTKQNRHGHDPELSDEEIDHLRELFSREVVPKLVRLQARMGMVSCEFGGEEYRCWQIRFRSRGSGFEIVDFEYEEEGAGLDLDL